MCVKLPFRDLNLDPYLPHSISTYTCGMAITLRVCGDRYKTYIKSLFGTFPNYFICELINMVCTYSKQVVSIMSISLFIYAINKDKYGIMIYCYIPTSLKYI